MYWGFLVLTLRKKIFIFLSLVLSWLHVIGLSLSSSQECLPGFLKSWSLVRNSCWILSYVSCRCDLTFLVSLLRTYLLHRGLTLERQALPGCPYLMEAYNPDSDYRWTAPRGMYPYRGPIPFHSVASILDHFYSKRHPLSKHFDISLFLPKNWFKTIHSTSINSTDTL